MKTKTNPKHGKRKKTHKHMNKIYPITESDMLFDQDILTKRKCPKCGALIVSHPDCTERCSNNKCDYKLR